MIYSSVYSFVLASEEKIYQTLKTIFDHLFKTTRYASYFELSSPFLEMWSNTVLTFDIIVNNPLWEQ